MGLGDMFSRIFTKEEVDEENPAGSVNDKASGVTNREGDSVPKESIDSKDAHKIEQGSEIADSFQRGELDTKNESSEHHHHSNDETIGSDGEQVSKDKILEILSDVYDPEIPIDIVNLGLIYDVGIEDGHVFVKMTMTSPGCPASGEIVAESKMLIEELPGVRSASIEVVWDPPWDPSKMSDEARQSMGF